jgi:hypothetical protein
MSRHRISEARLPRAAGQACVWLIGLAGLVGCDTYSTFKNAPIDCTADEGYDFDMKDSSEAGSNPSWWCSGDDTPGKKAEVAVEAVEGGGRCGSTAATVMRAFHNNDWGSVCGYNNFGKKDESAYEGLSFWARSPGNTSKSFEITLGDPNTTAATDEQGNPVIDPDTGLQFEQHCVNYPSTTNNNGGATSATGPNGESISTSSSASRSTYPEECGNDYGFVRVVTGEWAFYTIPFANFQQDALPNRVPNAFLTEVGPSPGTALLTNKIRNLQIRMPKEADIQLWLDNVAFYRKRPPGAPGPERNDAGRDTLRADSARIETSPIDSTPIDAEPIDAEPIDAQPIDAAPVDGGAAGG